MQNNNINKAIANLQAGKMVLLIDDHDRENEADLIFAAEYVNEENMRFMLQHTCGIVCLAMTEHQANQLGLPLLMPGTQNTSQQKTPFGMSFEARAGVTTGISVADRVTTVQAAIGDDADASDIVMPGHMFPLIAQPLGVLTRRGHTEGSVDLMHLAGLKPASVICELVNPDYSVAKGAQVKAFADKYQIPVVSIQEIVDYRLQHENFIEEEASSTLPLAQYGAFKITVFKDKLQQQEHVILEKESVNKKTPTLVRVHSSCVTGDIFHSLRCDCYEQLHYSLELISKEGGLLIYLDQEGRGIGLLNKIKAYALQENKFDTVEANEQLGFAADQREYYLAANVLRNKGISEFRLLTNNPNKITHFNNNSSFKVQRESMPVFVNETNKEYLLTKKNKLHHHINLEQ